MSITLVLVDDHPIILQGLQRLFEREGEFEVLRSCSGGDEALDAVRSGPPDVLVLDLKMPDRHGLDVLRTLRAEHRECRTVILTAAMRDDEIAQALELGVAGIVMKEASPAALVACVRAVHHGKRSIDRDILDRVSSDARKRSFGPTGATPLTPREIEIVHLVTQGLRNKELANRLSITEGTVKIHLHNIYDKLGVDGRLELVLCAQQRGLVP